jgi:hypothetical protein
VVQVRCDRVNVKMTGREGHALSEVLATTLGALASDTRGRANTRVAGQHVERSHPHPPHVPDLHSNCLHRDE